MPEPCSLPGTLPLSLLWPNLALGLLAARRDAPLENPHLDEMWQIGLRLDVPDKTPDHHVSAILAKLAVRSRGEAVAAARRLGA